MAEGVDNPVFTSLDEVGLKKVASIRLCGEPEHERLPEISKRQYKEENYEEGPCGWPCFTPRSIQVCNNPVGYLVFFSLLAIMQGTVVNGLVNVSISTIEKRYQLNSSLTGVVAASYDIAFCVLSLFVSFYGQRGHKPRWLAFSAFLIGLGAIIFSLPHFTSGLYEYGADFEAICATAPTNTSTHTCSPSSTSADSNYLYVFIVAQLILGAGGTPLYTLGTAFFDDSLPTHKSSLFIGIGYGMSVVGPAVGYVLGGQLLNIYIDVDQGNSFHLTSDDPQWLGAWWIGFVLCCFMTWMLIPPFSCFPKHLPGTAKVQAEKVSQAHNNGSEEYVEEKDIGKTFQDFPVALMVLLRNPVFMCLTISSCSDGFVTAGFATFLPKFIENQFSQSSSFSATIGGGVLIPGAVIGQIVGGIIISKTKMKCRNIMKYSVIVAVVSLALSSVFLFTKCGNHSYAGVSVKYNGTGVIGELTAPCNANCSCLRSSYDPVCGADNIQYFSPCYAGCSSSANDKDGKVYSNCSCIGIAPHDQMCNICQARAGKCASSCTHMTLFMGLFFFVVVTTFMTATPVTMAILRCVPDKQRSFALGVQWLFVRLLGAIPGPILFGITIDSACILWNIEPCGGKGACWTYNNDRMSNLLIAMSASCKVITIVFLILAFCLYKPPAEKGMPLEEDSAVIATVTT
ncbi:solute carrier organic anion transporter family member 4C1 [Ambystoma mexicanum]|uniref:solute carrier organic anion transporter family member 4C1 n=1 Tax=Ambystoma mexicanum TaxID=8296 RepID=UPI0037E6FFED